MSERRDVLEALLNHPGWALFYAHAKEEWGASGCWRKAKEQNLDLAKIDYTNQEIGALLEWPKHELDRLKRQETPIEPSLSRRGGL